MKKISIIVFHKSNGFSQDGKSNNENKSRFLRILRQAMLRAHLQFCYMIYHRQSPLKKQGGCAFVPYAQSLSYHSQGG